MIVAFHAKLDLHRIIIQRSFAHSIEQLATLEYFTREQIYYVETDLIKMLNDMAFEVSKRKCKNSIGKMFSIESALVERILLKWFNQKFKRQFEKINPVAKLRYESQNPIDWKKGKCAICKFPLKIQPTNFQTLDDEMSFGDFVIRYEHKFLRNIYTEKEVDYSYHIKDLESYCEIFEKYIEICVGLLALLNNVQRNNFINLFTEEFVEDMFPGEDIGKIKNTINKTEIKNLNVFNVPKFNLKVYAYVYDELINFPASDIEYETITTNKFFINVHRLIRGKFCLHHSHITGEIFGYAHDFCNTMLIKRGKCEIPFIAHNFFGFDLFYFLKAYVAPAWCSKEINIGGNSLTQTNFGNINGEIKLIDSLKFYQRSLGELSSTLTETEKNVVEKLTKKIFKSTSLFLCYMAIFKLSKEKQSFRNYIYRERNYTVRNHC